MTNSTKTNRTRKVAFASIELVMDFVSMEDAMRYREANKGKGWLFQKPCPIDSCEGFAVSMTIRKPYNRYNKGW
jgi:hypothetical protein